MVTTKTVQLNWPAPPVDKPKPVEKPKPVFPSPVPQRYELGGGYGNLFNTPFVCPMDMMFCPSLFAQDKNRAQQYLLEQCEMWEG